MKRRNNKVEAARKRLERVRTEVCQHIQQMCDESIINDKLITRENGKTTDRKRVSVEA
jgi:hypothetical protein